MPDSTKTLTPNQAAKRAGVSRASIMAWIKDHKIRANRHNDGWHIDEGALLAFLESRPSKGAKDSMPESMESNMPDLMQDNIKLRVENAELSGQIKALEALLEASKEDRERLRDELKNSQDQAIKDRDKGAEERMELLRMLERKEQMLERELSKGFFARLFGK